MLGIERDLIDKLGFKLVHDGQHNPDRYEHPPEDVRTFVRCYRRGDIEIKVKHDRRLGVGDIVRIEWHGAKREDFRQEIRKHKNGREFFVQEEVQCDLKHG